MKATRSSREGRAEPVLMRLAKAILGEGGP
jgi:hypothetical protein